MKKGEARRGEILACAEKLFYQKGYEETSIQDILDELHLSKGGFYHHFESKQQLLTAIARAQTASQREEIRQAVDRCAGDAVEKLNLLLTAALPWREENMAFNRILLKVAYQEGDVVIRECVREALYETVRPLLSGIVREGYEKKLFYTRFPDEIGELLLAVYANMNDQIAFAIAGAADASAAAGSLADRLEAARYAIELMLGAPYGSLTLFDPTALQGVMEALKGAQA